MPNEFFNPEYSTYQIFRAADMERCLDDDLNTIEGELEDLENNKSDNDHVHDGYAPTDHTHTGYAPTGHSHGMGDITSLFSSLAEKADLIGGKVPESQLPGYVDDVVDGTLVSATVFNGTDGNAVTPESGKVYNDTTTNKSYRWSGSQYVELNGGIALGETAATAHRGDHGKIAYEHTQNGDVHASATEKANWNSKAAGNHNHDAAYAAKAMLPTSDSGDVKLNWSGKDIVAEIAALPAGIYTAFGSTSGTNAPKAGGSNWRYFLHVVGTGYAWAQAFCMDGSYFVGVMQNSVWLGWTCIYDANPAPLWSGAFFMNAAQTITPSKPLSKCRNGWVLLWSDYDTANGGATNGDVYATYVPKTSYTGGNWAGHSWLADIPVEAASNAETRCIKKLYMWNDRIVGNAINETSPRNDVVLRAVLEY